MKKLLALGLLAMVASTLSVTLTAKPTTTKQEVVVKPDVSQSTFAITATPVDAVVFVAEETPITYSVKSFRVMTEVIQFKTVACYDVGWRYRYITSIQHSINKYSNWHTPYKINNRYLNGLFARRLPPKYQC